MGRDRRKRKARFSPRVGSPSDREMKWRAYVFLGAAIEGNGVDLAAWPLLDLELASVALETLEAASFVAEVPAHLAGGPREVDLVRELPAALAAARALAAIPVSVVGVVQ